MFPTYTKKSKLPNKVHPSNKQPSLSDTFTDLSILDTQKPSTKKIKFLDTHIEHIALSDDLNILKKQKNKLSKFINCPINKVNRINKQEPSNQKRTKKITPMSLIRSDDIHFRKCPHDTPNHNFQLERTLRLNINVPTLQTNKNKK
jgi:hypothetical protein